MATIPDARVTDNGTELILLIQKDGVDFDPGLANWVLLFILLPNGTVLEVEPAIYEDPDDGNKKKVRHIFHDQLTITGDYQVQGYVWIDDDNHWHTDVFKFKVGANLKDVPDTPPPGA